MSNAIPFDIQNSSILADKNPETKTFRNMKLLLTKLQKLNFFHAYLHDPTDQTTKPQVVKCWHNVVRKNVVKPIQ